MLLGIDYGTTRTVAAAVEKGNYPISSFENESGDMQDWYPSLIAARGPERRYGFDATACARDGEWTILRSLKRQLGNLGPDAQVLADLPEVSVLQLLTEFLAHFMEDLSERSNLRLSKQSPLEALVSVPANANSNQRFITLEAFRRAGFRVTGMINEPSAAAVEYAHSVLASGSSGRREHIAVYDLGAGTFDAAVLNISGRAHEVVHTAGIARLGGDDFDAILMEIALGKAGITDIGEKAGIVILDECRERKEGLHPNTRRIIVDLGRGVEGEAEVIVGVDEFYEACRPLVDRTIRALEQTVRSCTAILDGDWNSIAAVYMVGGASELPLVSRMLREHYGRRLRKAAYPHAAVAIGLAIMADAGAGYSLRERFTRHFGVWREIDSGRAVAFDPLFHKGTLLPAAGEGKLLCSRMYRPEHNIGHFRYLECGEIVEGQPTGDITPWDEILFPFDSSLETHADLIPGSVARTGIRGDLIEELYSCDESGMIEATIINHASGHQRCYRLRNQPPAVRQRKSGATRREH